MKTLNVKVICKAVYSSEIKVPDELTLEEAIEYAKQHMDDINVGEMDWISDEEIYEDDCDFEEEEE